MAAALRDRVVLAGAEVAASDHRPDIAAGRVERDQRALVAARVGGVRAQARFQLLFGLLLHLPVERGLNLQAGIDEVRSIAPKEIVEDVPGEVGRFEGIVTMFAGRQ